MKKKTSLWRIVLILICGLVVAGIGALIIDQRRAREAAELEKKSRIPIKREAASPDLILKKVKGPLPFPLSVTYYASGAQAAGQWAPAEINPRAIKLSKKEDLDTARAAIDRYLAGFRKIRSLRFRLTEAANALDLELERDPLRLRATGTLDGKPIQAAAGTEASGLAQALLASFLGGEMWFTRTAILEETVKIREEAIVDKELPQVGEFLGDPQKQDAVYTVVEALDMTRELVYEHWFNQATGLLDLIVLRMTMSPDKGTPYTGAAFIQYAKANGVDYPVRWTSYSDDFSKKTEGAIANLAVNETAGR
ncbi:MAG: hypothetical protein V1918_07020 [Planctomycetota bacterium]